MKQTKSIRVLDEDYAILKKISEKEDGRDYYRIFSKAIRNYAKSKKIK